MAENPRIVPVSTVTALGYTTVASAVAGYIIATATLSILTPPYLALAVVVILAYMRGIRLLRRRLPTSRDLMTLASDVHKMVHRLVGEGYEMLVPPHSRKVTTIHLLIRTIGDDTIVITHVEWGRHHTHGESSLRQYEITPHGHVTRRVVGRYSHESDCSWCQAPLDRRQLEYLLAAAINYAPRCAASRP